MVMSTWWNVFYALASSIITAILLTIARNLHNREANARVKQQVLEISQNLEKIGLLFEIKGLKDKQIEREDILAALVRDMNQGFVKVEEDLRGIKEVLGIRPEFGTRGQSGIVNGDTSEPGVNSTY
ncbi:hypothetical protein BJ508DRAFT_322032 [Ascobolus immersus RN42]|uniref:Uncharacterized protein n=1 Tax=Ascobolus immersus RN42 TaxID=1160509 RepID=A0A3N4IJQ7_ASCIM|nr:hypothetical protein BJ508DRAFT_322032 [Ascobolus immersus RN42]